LFQEFFVALSFPPQTSENQKQLFALELCVFAQPGDGATAPSIEKQASLPFPPLRHSSRVFAVSLLSLSVLTPR